MREIELRERELELEVMRNREMGSGRDRSFDVGKYIEHRIRQTPNEGSQRRLNNSFGFRQRPTCAHCKKMGHVMSDCWRLRQNQSRSRGEIDTQWPVAAASLPPDKGKFQATVPSLNVDREFRPFMSEGSLVYLTTQTRCQAF